MTAIIPVKTKSLLSKAQKNFNQLKKKVETLQLQALQNNDKLDEYLKFYFVEISPYKNKTVAILGEQVKIIYVHYKNDKVFSKNQRAQFERIIMCIFGEIASFISPHEADPEIYQIYKELAGIDDKVPPPDDFDKFKEGAQQIFEEEGFDVNLDDLDPEDDPMEILEKLRDAFSKATDERIEESSRKKKTEKEIKREQDSQALKELQTKEVGKIYKQLARAFHPDLEQDPFQKTIKEQLMKKLTCAYESNDLHTILALEMEWIDRSSNQRRMMSDEQLQIYNALLKEQINTLKHKIEAAAYDARFLPIRHILLHPYFKGMDSMQAFLQNCKSEEFRLQKVTKKLKTKTTFQQIEGMFQHLLNIDYSDEATGY